jgi:hypothetical protein
MKEGTEFGWGDLLKGNFFKKESKNNTFRKAVIGLSTIMLPGVTGGLLIAGCSALNVVIGLYLIAIAAVFGIAFFIAC